MRCPCCEKPTPEREMHEYRSCEDCWVDSQPLRHREVEHHRPKNKVGENANIDILTLRDGRATAPPS